MLILFFFIVSMVLVLSFVCSLTESVLLSLNPLRLAVRSNEGRNNATRWLAMKNQIERPVSAILAVNTLANTGLATLAGAVFVSVFGSHWLWLYTIVITLLILFGTEILPKIYGVQNSEKLAPLLIGPLTAMLWLCHPIVVVMNWMCEKLKMDSATQAERRASSHIMDIIALTQAAKSQQLLHNREEIIIIHAATLSARRVKTAMVPGESVMVFQERQTLLENVHTVGPKLHRTYPVSVDGTLNNISSYVRIRELFAANLTTTGQATWMEFKRPALRIRDTASLTQLLALFLEKNEIAALVEDAQKRIVGWITMDDVVKVLMGQRI
jgi:CBS domain containing-hemolysin-like protein